mgnify:CR=1 FL=1|tara:strand:- start:2725 stop:2934 length:210 start_codon:yes stop_codon:yes gene_type:complete
MTVTTNELNQQNLFAKEPTMYITEEDMEKYATETHAERAEIWNSRTAMIGVIAGLVSYALTGKIFFGIY